MMNVARPVQYASKAVLAGAKNPNANRHCTVNQGLQQRGHACNSRNLTNCWP